MSWITAVYLFCLAGGATMPVAFAQDNQLGSKTFTHELDGREVRTTLSASLEAGDAANERVLNLNLDTEVEAGTVAARSGMINSFIAIACPPGIKPLAEPRPYYLDPQTGSYEFMYSRNLPDLPRLEGSESTMETAVGGRPEAMFAALAELSTALDPAVSPTGPRDPRLSGSDRSYTIGGVSWLLPVAMNYEKIVNLFETDSGVTEQAQMRISLPVKIEPDADAAGVLVYMGGLSTAVIEDNVAVAELPVTAIPLGDLPLNEGSAEDAETPPATVPALVFSYKWVSWESELALAEAGRPLETREEQEPPDLTESPLSSGRTSDVAVGEESERESLPTEAAEVFEPPLNEGDSVAVGAESPTESEENEIEDDAAPESTDDESVAKAVEPGTIPAFESERIVPLRPITNPGPRGSGGRQPISSGMLGGAPVYAAPPDLGEMILIPEGYFLMGTGESAQDSDQDEHPQQQVFLPDYYIDKYLVTNRQFYEFVLASGYKPQGNWERHFSPATADLPVRGISWDDCNSYARWAGKRLPTEAEWEKAIRGSDGRTYPWGEEWSASILPRGEFNYDVVIAVDAASPYGLLSTVGVLWQWTSSSYAPYPYDPEATGSYKVLRGGSFSNGRNVVRCANRYSEAANVALNTFGFRCAKDA